MIPRWQLGPCSGKASGVFSVHVNHPNVWPQGDEWSVLAAVLFLLAVEPHTHTQRFKSLCVLLSPLVGTPMWQHCKGIAKTSPKVLLALSSIKNDIARATLGSG
jgi:hypothetical protein